MKYLLILTVFVSFAVQALEPGHQTSVSNDTFINYQWGLENNGQRLNRDTDDTHPIVIESKPGMDIQWKELQTLLSTKTRKEVVVAVIDSGLSTTHEDIKDNVLPGLNFMVKKGDAPNDNVSDELGHGTHVAGIIAAQTNNSNGIAGVASGIKILPLKVYSATKKDEAAYIERVARAILAAVEKKVDVINLSLGWPLMLDEAAQKDPTVPTVQEAIQKALAQNITIVAAAGNDGHSLKVLPCSHKEVICVSAIGLNGDIPDFSNYGGQVDIMAPGESILSLWPVSLMQKHFGMRKYSVVSGSSQAAPFVSAAAAVLKSVYPGISNDEIKGRLFASTKNNLDWKGKFASNGLLQIASAVHISPQVVVRPILKKLDQVMVNSSTQEFSFSLPIKNYWAPSGALQIQLSGDQNISWTQKNFSIGNLGSGAEQILTVRGRVKDMSSNNKLKFSVEIKSGRRSDTYHHESMLTVRTDNLQRLRTFSSIPAVSSIVDHSVSQSNAEFFEQSITKDGAKITIYRIDSGKTTSSKSIFLPQVTMMYPQMGVVRVDLNLDGRDDYLITVVTKEGEDKKVKYFAYDKNLNPLFGNFSEWTLKDDGSALLDQPSTKFARWNSETLGNISIPVYWNDGRIPEADMNPDPFEREEVTARGLFYLTPVFVNGKMEMQTRLLNSEANVAQIRKRMGARFDQELNFIYFNIKDGKVQVLTSLGLSSLLKYYIVEFDLNSSNIQIRDLNLPSVNLSYHSTKKIDESRVAFFGIYNSSLARVAVLDLNTGNLESYNLSSDSLTNAIVALLSVREDGQTLNLFVEGADSFLLYKINKVTGHVDRSTSPINRFSYLPGRIFTDLRFPVTVAGQMALYVDSSQINANNVQMSTVGAQGISTPVKWSLELPKGCSALAPKKVFEEDQGISYIFLCKEGSSYTLKTYELK